VTVHRGGSKPERRHNDIDSKRSSTSSEQMSIDSMLYDNVKASSRFGLATRRLL